MRWCFSRLNTCCAHRKHWMCGYVKQVGWFITVICHLHWIVLITARSNSSFITTSSTAIAVAVFLWLLFFSTCVRRYKLSINWAKSSSHFIYIDMHWLKIWSSTRRAMKFSCKTGKENLPGHVLQWPHSSARSTFFLSLVNKILILAFQEQHKLLKSRCLCRKTGIGSFCLCKLKSSALDFVLCLVKLLEAELQTCSCLVPKLFQTCFILVIFTAFASENSQLILRVVSVPPAWPAGELRKPQPQAELLSSGIYSSAMAAPTRSRSQNKTRLG